MNYSQIKKISLALVLLFSPLLTHAQLKQVVFAPQWHANVQFAGYIAARELGFYQEEGLNVTIKYPKNKTSLEQLRDGKADIALGFLMSAIMLKSNEGFDLVNFMQTSQHTSLCLALKKPLNEVNIQNLKGMNVGLWAAQTAIAAKVMSDKYHLDWNIVQFREGIELLSYGVMDAISVMEYNELLRLKYAGRDVSEHSVFKMCEHGYDIPEEGAYCTREYYEQNKDVVDAFVRASKKGWEWCREHHQEAVDMVTNEMKNEYVSNSEVFQKAGLKVVLQKQELTPGNISYTLLPEQYDKAAKTLLEAEQIKTIPDFKTFIAQ